jgi:hypothetical protein
MGPRLTAGRGTDTRALDSRSAIASAAATAKPGRHPRLVAAAVPMMSGASSPVAAARALASLIAAGQAAP